jgi:hypothetical protein
MPPSSLCQNSRSRSTTRPRCEIGCGPAAAAARLPGRWGDGVGSAELARQGVERPIECEVGDSLPSSLAARVMVAARAHLMSRGGGRVFADLVVIHVLHPGTQDVVAARLIRLLRSGRTGPEQGGAGSAFGVVRQTSS